MVKYKINYTFNWFFKNCDLRNNHLMPLNVIDSFLKFNTKIIHSIYLFLNFNNKIIFNKKRKKKRLNYMFVLNHMFIYFNCNILHNSNFIKKIKMNIY